MINGKPFGLMEELTGPSSMDTIAQNLMLAQGYSVALRWTEPSRPTTTRCRIKATENVWCRPAASHALDVVLQFSVAHVRRPQRSYPFAVLAWSKREISLRLLARPLSVALSRCSLASPHHAAPSCTSRHCRALLCCSTTHSCADDRRLSCARARPSSLPPSLYRVESVPEHSCRPLSSTVGGSSSTTRHRQPLTMLSLPRPPPELSSTPRPSSRCPPLLLQPTAGGSPPPVHVAVVMPLWWAPSSSNPSNWFPTASSCSSAPPWLPRCRPPPDFGRPPPPGRLGERSSVPRLWA
jgi:hypothetical protein